MYKKTLIFILLIMPYSITLAGIYGSVSGYIRSVNTGADITNATVTVVETGKDVKTDFLARYLILDMPPGKFQIRVTAPGYKDQMKTIELLSGQDLPLNFFLEAAEQNLSTISSFSIDLGNLLDNTIIFNNEGKPGREYTGRMPNDFGIYPGVFVNDLGNQVLYPVMSYRGSSRLNVNINGIPLNNAFGNYKFLENQPDIMAFTSAAVIQPGGGTLFNDDVPSTGSISIVTRRPNPLPGVCIGQFYGKGNSFTTFVTGSTGRLGNFSLETGFVANTADGLIEKNWNNSMSYFIAMDYAPGADHRFEFTFLGSYKRHANRNEPAPLSYWDYDFAKELGVEDSPFMPKGSDGFDRNPLWGKTDFVSREYYLGKTHEPYSPDFLNHSVTYSHTPLGSLNWNWKLAEGLSLNNNFYFSIYSGGTSELSGIPEFTNGYIDFNKIYSNNTDSGRINPSHPDWGKESVIILQNDARIKNLYGWQGSLENKFSDSFSASLFFNFSNENIKTFREVRNLLGGNYIIDSVENQGRKGYIAYLGDVIDYYYEGIITKYGAGLSANASLGDFSAGLLIASSIYNYTNKDLYYTGYSDYKKNGMSDFRLHANLNYKISGSLGIFAKGGYHTSPPRFNAIFNNIYGAYDSLNYETGLNLDLGASYNISYFRVVLAFYYNNTSNYYMEDLGFMDMKSQCAGGEFSLFYKPNDLMELILSANVSESKFNGDGSSWISISEIFTSPQKINIKVKADGIYTGSAPQKTIAFSGTVFPYKNSFINLKVNFNADNYSLFNLNPFPSGNNGGQPWKIPDYFLLEAHASFDLPIIEAFGINLFANVYNLLNTRYIAFSKSFSNSPDSASVLFGLPFSWDIGLRIGF